MKKRGQYHSKRDQVTTGEAAKMLGVSMRTISNWMDKGSLPFWRVNKDRRMFVVDLLKFAEQNKMPVRHIENKIVGPSFRAIADKYANRADAKAYLGGKIRLGGIGTWGPIPMPPQTLEESDLQLIANWLATGAAK